MTDPVAIALIALAGNIFISLGNRRRAGEIKEQNVELLAQGDGIHKLVNSNLAKVKADLAATEARLNLALGQIEALRILVDALTGSKTSEASIAKAIVEKTHEDDNL